MNIINGQDVFGAQTLTTNFPMKVIDIDFFSPPQCITLGQEEDHYSTLLHLNINEQSLNGEDDDSLIIYIVIKQDNGNILQYPIYAPEGVLNVTNYGIKISKTEYYFPVVSTMTDHPHNGTIQFRIHAAAMVTDDPEDREGALIAASSKIKYRVDDSIAFNANVPSKFYDRFLEPSSGIVTPEMFQRADNAPRYTDDMLINMALKSNAKVVLMIGDYVLDSPIIIAGPTYQPKTIFHKGSITYTGKKILEKYGRDPDNSNWTISPYSVRLQDSYERTADSIDNIIFNNGIELDIETGLKYTNTNIKVHVYPKTKSAILITDIGSVCNITFDKIESSGDGIEFLSSTVRKNVGVSGTGSYDRTAVQYVNLYFGSISARYGEKIDNNAQVTGPNGNISGGKCIYFNLATIDESQKIPEYDAQQNIIGYHYYGISDIYAGGDNDTKKINGWLNEIRIYDGRLNSGAYGIYADGRTTENRINNVKIQNVALEPNNGPKKNVWVDYTSYLSTDQKRWIEAKNNNQGQNPPSPPPYLGYVEGGPKPSSTSPHFPEMMVFDVTKFSRKINIKDFYLIDVTDNYSDSDTTRYRYVYYQEIPFKKLYRGIYMANGCDRWSFSGLRYAEKPTVPQLMYREWGDQETVGGRYVAYITDESSDNEGKVNEDAEPQDIPTAKFYENAFSRSTQGWLLETVGTVREFLFEGAQYSSDSNFKFSDRTSGTLIMPNSDGETIQIEEGTTKVSHIFASFRTVTDGAISPFQEAETPYIEEIIHNMNALAVDTIMDAGGNTWETLTKNISTYRDFRYKDQNDNVVADPDLDPLNQKSNSKRYLRPRLVRGDSYGTYKYYYSFFGNTEIYDGLYKIDLELNPNNWNSTSSYNLDAIVKYNDKIWMSLEEIADDKIGIAPGVLYPPEPQEGEEQRYLWREVEVKVKNTYYFCKTDNGIKILPSRTYITHPSDSTNKIQEIEFGELEENDLFYYSPVLYTIKHDHIPGECDAVKTSNSDNICMTIYGLVDNNYTKNDVSDPYNDNDHTYLLKDGDGTNLPDNVRISITVRKLSYQSFEHDIFNIKENISDIEGDITEIEEDITEIEGNITNIEENISNIDFQEEIHFSASDDKRPYNYKTVSNGIILPRLLIGSTYSSSNKPYQYIYSEQNIIDKFKDGAYYIKLTNSNTINSYYFIKIGSYIRICPKIGNETISNDTPILINAKEDYIPGEASISQAIGDNLGITTQTIYNDLQQGNVPSDNTGRVQILVEVKKLSYEDSKKIISQFLCGLEDKIDNLDARIYALEHSNS